MDLEMKSPSSCSYSVTVRRNPHRRARPTPSSAAPLSLPPLPSTKSIPSFPINEILSININNPQNPNQSPPPEPSISNNLKVFLRIRPLEINNQVATKSLKKGVAAARKNVWPQNPSEKMAPKAKQNKKSEICLTVKDEHSVTLCPPQSLQDQRRVKTEIYEGFSYVFAADSSQDEVYGRMVNPLVEDFLKGKSGMLAALGPSGSGKTHTVFGSIRDPGMVPLALRRIFSHDAGNGAKSSRTFYLSMFEIHSEKGKGERVLDLSQDGGDVCLQQSMIKGLQEVAIFDAQQAESLIACGLLKRATAMTNSNSQSSRSQCIINIRSALNNIDVECDTQSNSAMLTIVDLAGAEREKRTGNQGARLLESNFINNTSMVFGQCLRSLLEHQKNKKKPLQKHFQSSLLTRYLRDYLEGKRRMTLILTVKSGGEDYTDASFLLRQASPFMNIKFDVVEELPSNSFGNKRQFQTFPKAEQLKRMKITNGDTSMGEKDKGGGTQFRKEEVTPELVKEHEPTSTLVQSPSIISLDANDNKSLNVIEPSNQDREHQIMIKFGKALWNVLKEYKRKLEVAEDEVYGLKESLAVEKERRSQLEDELNDMKSFGSCAKEVSEEMSLVEVHESVNAECQSTVIDEVVEHEVSLKERLAIEVERCSELEKDLNGMKSCCSCRREVSVEENPVKVDESIATELAELEQCQSTSMDEACVQVSSSNLKESQPTDDTKITDSTAGNSVVISLSAVENSEAQTCQNIGNENVGCYEDLEDHKHKDKETTNNVTGSMLQESVVRSSQSQVLVGDDSLTLTKEGELQHEEEVIEKISLLTFKDPEDKNRKQVSNSTQLDNPMILLEDIINSERCSFSNVSEEEAKSKPFCQAVNPGNNQIVPGDNITNPSEMCSVSSVSKSEVTLSPSPNLVNPGKPKRRLQPTSSISLKNINALEFDDENEKPKKQLDNTIQPEDIINSEMSSTSKVPEGEAKSKPACQAVNPGNNQIVPSDNITNPSEMCSVSNVSRSEVNLPPSPKLVNPGKPKRRLQPASSILLKNINTLEFDDENEKPKGRRKEKKASVVDVTKKTQGNIALLRLLTDNLHL